MNIKNFLEKGNELVLPNLSIDIVIIGYEANELKCLLLQIGDKWLLPGGFVLKNESVENATKRILKERTDLENTHFKFLEVFGDKDRRFKQIWKDFYEKSGLIWTDYCWLNTRFVSLVYYALVDMENTFPALNEIDEAFAWYSFENLPSMWMDHKTIALTARKRLKEDIKQEHITFNLLSDEFTMPELHELHQTILCEKLDRSRFQKKMLSSNLFERLPEKNQKSPGRNPYRYKIKPKKI
ncbi:NUDIX hydrolase [Namhaeicola litoreus]|uniref:NUDIX domain-containing protein n=1 Tax=Namhaeicola litoreus TaxID=1052145 RepID=A0ABW3XXI9_9FLAO